MFLCHLRGCYYRFSSSVNKIISCNMRPTTQLKVPKSTETLETEMNTASDSLDIFLSCL